MMLVEGSDRGIEKLKSALGLKGGFDVPRWPLPNLKPSSEGDFWSWQCSYGYIAKAHVMGQKVDGKHADIFIYRMPDTYTFIDGGFAIIVTQGPSYRRDQVAYFEWRACQHEFEITNSRMCYREYTCKHCKKKGIRT